MKIRTETTRRVFRAAQFGLQALEGRQLYSVSPLGQLGSGEQRQDDDGCRGGDQSGVTSPYGPGAYFQSASGTRDISRLDMHALTPS